MNGLIGEGWKCIVSRAAMKDQDDKIRLCPTDRMMLVANGATGEDQLENDSQRLRRKLVVLAGVVVVGGEGQPGHSDHEWPCSKPCCMPSTQLRGCNELVSDDLEVLKAAFK